MINTFPNKKNDVLQSITSNKVLTAPKDSVAYYLFFKRVILRESGFSTAGSYCLVA